MLIFFPVRCVDEYRLSGDYYVEVVDVSCFLLADI